MQHLIPLTRPDLDALGIPPGWAFGRADKARFSELDPLNHVNNAGYLSWLETARIGYFDWIGLDRGNDTEMRLVLVASSLEYHAPVHLNETYVVCVRTSEIGRTSFTTEYAVFVGGRKTTSGRATMVCMTADLSKKLPVPAKARAAFIADGATER